MEFSQLHSLLDKYRQNNCTEAERQQVEAWLDDIRHTGWAPDEALISNQLDRIKANIDRRHFIPATAGRMPSGKTWLRMAAALILLAGASAAVWWGYTAGKARAPLAVVAMKSTTIPPTALQTTRNGWVEWSTQPGITHRLRLPDGTEVVLNASSKLRYPLHFSAARRPVYLDEGEAYFNVAFNAGSAFTVYTPQLATTALGTAFNIRSYSREHQSSISLLQGKIKIEDLRKTSPLAGARILSPHQQLVLDKTTAALQSRLIGDEDAVTAWKEGYLLFHDASLEEVVTGIENRYGIRIENRSGKQDWSYTGSFREECLEEVLQTICLTEGIRFRMEQGHQVILYQSSFK